MKSPPRLPDAGGDARVPETHALTLPLLHTQELPGTKVMTGGAKGAGEGGSGRPGGGYRHTSHTWQGIHERVAAPHLPLPLARPHTPVKGSSPKLGEKTENTTPVTVSQVAGH